MNRQLQVPFSKEEAKTLKAGDYVYLTGTIYTARDAAHKRMQEAMDRGEELPVSIEGNIIYYMGPSPAREGRPIGSAGPTTSSRMDKYAPAKSKLLSPKPEVSEDVILDETTLEDNLALAERVEAYRPQIRVYSRALEQILELPVKRQVLYFFRTGQTVEL